MTLTPEQQALWDEPPIELPPHIPPAQPTEQQRIKDFQRACQFDGLGVPSEEDIRELIETHRRKST